MFYVDSERCHGCGECASICPTAAITLQGDIAFIDEHLCSGCEACLSACPQNAILPIEAPEPVLIQEAELAPQPVQPEMISAPTQGAALSLRDWALPAIGSALVWTAQELVPRLASLALDLVDQRIQSTRLVSPERGARNYSQIMPERPAHGGRRRRQRRRKKMKGGELDATWR